jgi:hypothetical protein
MRRASDPDKRHPFQRKDPGSDGRLQQRGEFWEWGVV